MLVTAALSDQLKAETQRSHQELERPVIPKIKGARTTDSYIQLLKLFYGYHKPLEDAIERQLCEEQLPDLKERRKADLILKDLRQVGYSCSDIALCKDIPAIREKAVALGAMYVLEGSTLGGKIISRMLVKSLRLETISGVGFFYGYGEETMIRWNSFKQYLNDFAKDEEVGNKIITAATQTFRKFKEWIDANDQKNGK